jgi:hypothetical protein
VTGKVDLLAKGNALPLPEGKHFPKATLRTHTQDAQSRQNVIFAGNCSKYATVCTLALPLLTPSANNTSRRNQHRQQITPGSFAMYILFAAPALSFVTILAMSLHSQFATRPNL